MRVCKALEVNGEFDLSRQFWSYLLKKEQSRIRSPLFTRCPIAVLCVDRRMLRFLRMNGKRRLLGSFNHRSMANALPQAIGVQASHPGRQVVTLSGDGGLAMLMGDLLSLPQLKTPVKIIVFKNDSLAFVELEMKAAGFVDFGTDLQNPNFAKMAEAIGLLGLTAGTGDQVRPMIAQALEHDGPALVEIPVSRQELSMPPTITLEQIKGFSLFALRAVFSGRGDEIVDLTKINLFR
jgi:pyruvate dehydrogenase (quinone)